MLYHRYRPETLDDMTGNEPVLQALRADLAKKPADRPHAFLLTGPYGCGKTTVGRIIARELGCAGNDYRELDSAEYRGIDSIRDMRKQSNYLSLEGPCQVWLCDEAAKLTPDAQSALLKALEDPPPHVYYILATTDPQKLLETIKSRCSQYALRTLEDAEMFRLVRRVAKSEGQALDREVIEQIVLDSQGHPRDALQILDQVLSAPPDKRLETARRQAEAQSQVIELCRALIKREGWKRIAGILAGLKGEEPERVRQAVMGYCNAILLREDSTAAATVLEQFIEPRFATGFSGITFACYSAMHVMRSANPDDVPF